jgi:hypothetical protein
MVPRKQAGHMTCTRPQAARQLLLATRASSKHDPELTSTAKEVGQINALHIGEVCVRPPVCLSEPISLPQKPSTRTAYKGCQQARWTVVISGRQAHKNAADEIWPRTALWAGLRGRSAPDGYCRIEARSAGASRFWLRFFKPQRRQFGGRGPRLPTTSNGPRKSLLRCDDTLFSQTISLLCGVGN